MFGGRLYACGGTSLVLVHCVASAIVVNNTAHTCSVLPGVSRRAQYMVLLTCSWDKPPWLRTSRSLTHFSPSRSQAMGKRAGTLPAWLPYAPQKRMGAAMWLLILQNVPDSVSETVGDRVWKTSNLRHQGLIHAVARWLTRCSLLGQLSKNTSLQLGVTIKVT